tara:strand:- start:116 stop:400 length:285 start_codon:yes stop_codon:yes gene_type:complete
MTHEDVVKIFKEVSSKLGVEISMDVDFIEGRITLLATKNLMSLPAVIIDRRFADLDEIENVVLDIISTLMAEGFKVNQENVLRESEDYDTDYFL